MISDLCTQNMCCRHPAYCVADSILRFVGPDLWVFPIRTQRFPAFANIGDRYSRYHLSSHLRRNRSWNCLRLLAQRSASHKALLPGRFWIQQSRADGRSG
jgi:hypothetical protein